MAGVSRMDYRTFVTYNAIGALLWGVGVTLLGYLLGQVEFVHENIEPILIAIVVISLIPVAVELLRARRSGVALLSHGPGSRPRTEVEAGGS